VKESIGGGVGRHIRNPEVQGTNIAIGLWFVALALKLVRVVHDRG
jgi:hypothetical protein